MLHSLRRSVGIWQAIPCLVVLCNCSIIASTLLYFSHPFAYELTRSNIFYFALPLAVLPACCHCLVYFNKIVQKMLMGERSATLTAVRKLWEGKGAGLSYHIVSGVRVIVSFKPIQSIFIFVIIH